MPGRRFDEFQVGQVIRHTPTLHVTQEDNAAFCRLTLNNQPLHLDEAYARTSSFGRIVVNGLYTMSAAVGVSVEDTTAGTLVANLGYDKVEHPNPVFPGDTLRFETEVKAARPSSKPGRGVVTLEHRVHKAAPQANPTSPSRFTAAPAASDGEADLLVCRFLRTVMVQA